MRITKNTLKRAGRTFIQAAIAYATVNIVAVPFSEDKATIKTALIGLGVSAVAAGVAAVMNLEKDEHEEADYESE